MSNKIKTAFLYLLILAGGLGSGWVLAHIPNWLKKPYNEGNYAQYYPNAQTKVVIYGTQSCPYCAKTREFLKAKNIAFADFDVQKSDKANKEFTALGGGGVPMILVGNRQIQGFQQKVLEESLQKVGL